MRIGNLVSTGKSRKKFREKKILNLLIPSSLHYLSGNWSTKKTICMNRLTLITKERCLYSFYPYNQPQFVFGETISKSHTFCLARKILEG